MLPLADLLYRKPTSPLQGVKLKNHWMSVSPFGLNMFHLLWQQRLVKDFDNIQYICYYRSVVYYHACGYCQFIFFIIFILPKVTTLRHGLISLLGVCTKLPCMQQLLVATLLSILNGIQWILLWNVVLTSHKQPLSVNLHILGGCWQEAQLHYHGGKCSNLVK